MTYRRAASVELIVAAPQALALIVTGLASRYSGTRRLQQ